jgi:hypothetical protein
MVYTGSAPAKSDSGWLTYDSSSKPTVHDGERIAYYSVDAAAPAGNEEGVQHSLALSVDTAAPVLSSLTASPNPTNVTTSLGYSLSENANVTLAIYDSSNNLVRTMISNAGRSAGTNSEPWDLKDGASATVADGTYTYKVDATDAAANNATQQSATVTVDRTAPAPTVTGPADAALLKSSTPSISGTAGSQAADSSHSADGTQITVKIWSGSSASGSPARTFTTTRSGASWSLGSADWTSADPAKAPLSDGTWTVRADQSDAAGNTNTSSTHTFKVDKTAPLPTLTSPASNSSVSTGTPTFAGTGGTQASTSSASADAGTVTVNVYSGTSAFGTPVEALNVARDATTGAYSVSASPALANGTYTAQTAQGDAAGNTGFSQPVTFTVNTLNYNFTGFFPPVTRYDPTNVVFNQVNAGAAVPVKFSLGGNKGLDIFEAGYPISQAIPCTSGAAVDGVDQTVNAGQSSLSYDSTTGQYNYVWKTDKSWSSSGANGPCRQFVIKFKDGTYQRANFKFTK